MQIAHITNALKLNGTGHTNSTIDLAIAQSQFGHKVTFICEESDQPTRELLKKFGIELIEGISARSIGELRSARSRIASLLRRHDVIHAHTVRSMVVSAAAGPLSAWRKSVATVHNPHQSSTVAMCICKRIVVLNERQRRSLRRRTLYARRPITINNGTAGTPRLAPVAELERVPLPPRSILFVGALHERKGLDVLINAMQFVVADVPDAELYVIGNRDSPAFELLASILGVENKVHFVGFITDPRRYMLSSRVFVLPSREEGFGNVLTEARECRVAIVASDVGGIPEALEAGRAGRLVPADDPFALATALTDVLTNDDMASDLQRSTALNFDRLRPSRARADYDAVYESL